jgi:hypothetical protein
LSTRAVEGAAGGHPPLPGEDGSSWNPRGSTSAGGGYATARSTRAASLSSTPTARRRLPIKIVHCPCGENVEGENDDALVESVNEHIATKHPDMVGKYSREEILEMAHDTESSSAAGAAPGDGWLSLPAG